jgi:diguanylate cyclase (GGDEF)-like protein/PAS domain S-box-containing protein
VIDYVTPPLVERLLLAALVGTSVELHAQSIGAHDPLDRSPLAESEDVGHVSALLGTIAPSAQLESLQGTQDRSASPQTGRRILPTQDEQAALTDNEPDRAMSGQRVSRQTIASRHDASLSITGEATPGAERPRSIPNDYDLGRQAASEPFRTPEPGSVTHDPNRRENATALGQKVPDIPYGSVAIIVFLSMAAYWALRTARSRINTNTELRHAYRYAQHLIDSSPDPLLIVGVDGMILTANAAASSLFGYPQQHIKGMFIERLMPDRFRTAHVHLREEAFRVGSSRPMGSNVDLVALRSTGEEIPVEISISYVTNAQKQVAIVTLRDISDRKKADELLKLGRAVFEYSREAILVLNDEGKLIDCNSAFLELVSQARDDALGHCPTLSESSSASPADFCTSIWPEIRKRGFWNSELYLLRESDPPTPCMASIAAVNTAYATSLFVCILLDISELKEAQSRLEKLAHYDQLTGLATRSLFQDRLHSAMRRADRTEKGFAIVYLDLDSFKPINDTFGHAIGDEVLVKFSDRLRHCLRSDDTVSRLGGDEFAVILHDQAMRDEVESTLERMLAAVTFEVSHDNQNFVVSASMGVACYPHDSTTAEGLIRCADKAMYRAKVSTSMGFIFHSD